MTRSWKIYREETRCEWLQRFRTPLQFFTIPLGVALPYIFLVLIFPPDGTGPLMLVMFGALGTLNLGLLGLGLTIASERAQGWMRLKRATPMPVPLHFAAKITVTLLGATLFALALLLVAAWAGHLPDTIGELARVFVLIILGALAFCALGLALAYVGGPNTAQSLIPQAVILLVALVWLPLLADLPGPILTAIQALNILSPLHHFTVLTFGFTGLPALQGGPAWLHALALLGLTALYTTLAVYLYRRDEGRTYG